MQKVLQYFHHIHHVGNKHKVHHCGGEHKNFDYKIEHCQCGKHRIDKPQAVGHDFDGREVLFKFTEKCPQGGWHVESGILI